jgi:hypothetical protein
VSIAVAAAAIAAPIAIALAIPTAAAAAATGDIAAPRTFYIAPGGNDAHAGTKGAPFASLEGARDAIRRLKTQGGWPAGGVTVWLRGGLYERARAFELSAADSGTATAPVRYRAWRAECPRILGGVRVPRLEPVADPAVLGRLPAAAHGAVLQADLSALGAGGLGQLRSRGFARPQEPSHLELFFDGKPMTLARWPNEGQWAKIAGFPAATGQGDEHGGTIGALDAGFLYAGDRPRGWAESDDIWVHGYWAWDWANSYERVATLDRDQRLVRTAPPRGHYGFRKDQRFYFLNVLEELDEPGEFYVDRAAARLYFWPPAATGRAEALVSVLEQPLVELNGAAHVWVEGLLMESARGDGIRIRGGASNVVAGCTLRLLGNWGVRVEGGVVHRVISCDIEDTGDGGVWIDGGDRQTLAPGGHVVENCRFRRQGRWSKCYVPSVLAGGVGHRIAHNLVRDHPHCAILYSGNDHTIEFNEIHHVALETGDVGAIYSGRDWTYRGNVIRHNFIHHTGGVGMGSMGVYMDDCVSGTAIFGNIFYKVSRAAFLGGGRDHVVENNVFVDCTPAVAVDGRGMDKSPVWHNMVRKTMKRQLDAVPRGLYRARYPALATLDPYYQGPGDPGIPPEHNVVQRNICAGGKWTEIAWHADPKTIDMRDNWVGADPGFVGPARMDFRLKPGAPGLQAGFKPIPVERIGPQPDAYRRKGTKLDHSAPSSWNEAPAPPGTGGKT